MNEKEIIELEEKIMAQTFAKRDRVITRGKGALVWDINGNEYIDCTGSYGVAVVGHCHPKVVEAVQKQVEKLIAIGPKLLRASPQFQCLIEVLKAAAEGLPRPNECPIGAGILGN